MVRSVIVSLICEVVKSKRVHRNVTDTTLKEYKTRFTWLRVTVVEPQSSGDSRKLVMKCDICIGENMSNAFTAGCKNVQKSAILRHEQSFERESAVKRTGKNERRKH